MNNQLGLSLTIIINLASILRDYCDKLNKNKDFP